MNNSNALLNTKQINDNNNVEDYLSLQSAQYYQTPNIKQMQQIHQESVLPLSDVLTTSKINYSINNNDNNNNSLSTNSIMKKDDKDIKFDLQSTHAFFDFNFMNNDNIKNELLNEPLEKNKSDDYTSEFCFTTNESVEEIFMNNNNNIKAFNNSSSNNIISSIYSDNDDSLFDEYQHDIYFG
jgi:hypothetical protein